MSRLTTRDKSLVDLVDGLAPTEGITSTAWPGLTVVRCSSSLPRQPMTYVPSLCVVLQGQKRVYFGEQVLKYDPSNYLMVTVGLPLDVEIEASPENHLLALALEIEMAAVSQLLIDLGDEPEEKTRMESRSPALFVSRIDSDLSEALGRLLRAVSRPTDLKVLGPSINREIIYRILRGEQGDMLRTLLLRSNMAHRIARIARYLKDHCAEPWTVELVARKWGMSKSTLHHNFRDVTGMSPLQFIKRTRLHEARAIILEQQMGVAEAGFKVGYESPSQFSREFKRLFGVSPGKATLLA